MCSSACLYVSQFELVGDPEDRMSVPESWHRVARTARMTTTHRPMMDDEEDAMIQQALAASLLLGV